MKMIKSALTAIGLLACMAVTSVAQTPSAPGPYNIDTGVLITNTLRTAGTVTSAVQTNLNWRGVVCRFVQTVSSGSPSTTFGIQVYDAASATWLTYLAHAAVTGYPSDTPNTPIDVAIYPGMQITSLPTNMTGLSAHLPRTWRLTQTIGNGTGAAGPAITGKIGCNYLN